MRCPTCASQHFSIRIAFTGVVSCRFFEDGVRQDQEAFELTETLSLESQWSDHSACACLSCEWQGQLRDVRAAAVAQMCATSSTRSVDSQPRTAVNTSIGVELDEIREELLSMGCDAHWQVRIEELMSEVERLDALLEMVARAKKAEQNGSGEDTVVE